MGASTIQVFRVRENLRVLRELYSIPTQRYLFTFPLGISIVDFKSH